MNITKLGCRGSKTTHRKLDDESILSLLTAGNTQTLIEKVREKLQSAIPDKSYKFIQRIPRLIFAGIFKMDGERLLLKEYTGCVLLEINHLKGLEEARELRAQIAAYPQTLWAFVGASGRSVKFVVPYTRPDELCRKRKRKRRCFMRMLFVMPSRLTNPDCLIPSN